MMLKCGVRSRAQYLGSGMDSVRVGTPWRRVLGRGFLFRKARPESFKGLLEGLTPFEALREGWDSSGTLGTFQVLTALRDVAKDMLLLHYQVDKRCRYRIVYDITMLAGSSSVRGAKPALPHHCCRPAAVAAAFVGSSPSLSPRCHHCRVIATHCGRSHRRRCRHHRCGRSRLRLRHLAIAVTLLSLRHDRRHCLGGGVDSGLPG